jgi:hypothetical protein
MLTVDTHYPKGYTCRLCEDTYDSSYANAIACSDRQVSAFLKWCMKQDWYEDTAIVVSGDHPTMATFCIWLPMKTAPMPSSLRRWFASCRPTMHLE